MSDPSRRFRPSSDVKFSCWNESPNDAWWRPAVWARSTKNGPKLCVERSTVPSSGFKRYTKPLDEVATGSVARFASTAREIVWLVASAAVRSRWKSPVDTDWFVTRNVSTSETVCASVRAAVIVATSSAARILVMSTSLLDHVRVDDVVVVDRALAGHAVAALRDVAA